MDFLSTEVIFPKCFKRILPASIAVSLAKSRKEGCFKILDFAVMIESIVWCQLQSFSQPAGFFVAFPAHGEEV